MATPGISSAETSPPEPAGLIAPGWHTAVVIIFLLALAALSAWRGALSPVGRVGANARAANYAVVFVWEWLTVAFIAWGVRKRGHGLSELVGGRWPTLSAFGRDLGISALFMLGSGVILGIIRWAMQDRPNPALLNLLPDSPAEMALWVVLSATAGFCEETIFRGYLQQQFAVLTGDKGAGAALQAIVFGACHGYQGAKSIVSIAVYGFLFGLLANYVKNLRPGMMAHFLQDSVAGLTGRALLKRIHA